MKTAIPVVLFLAACLAPTVAQAQDTFRTENIYIGWGEFAGEALDANVDEIRVGEMLEATLAVPAESPFAEALRKAFKSRHRLDGLVLRASTGQGRRSMSWELTEAYVTSYSVSGSSRIVRLRGTISPAAGSFSQPREKPEPQPLPLTAPRPLASSQGWYVNPPYVSLSVDGVEIARFSKLVALDSRSKPPTVVLKRAKDNSMEMWAWHEAARMGDLAAARKSASLVVYGYNGAVARYHLENAWPSKIEIGSLKAGSSEVLMETVTIVCEHIQRVSH